MLSTYQKDLYNFNFTNFYEKNVKTLQNINQMLDIIKYIILKYKHFWDFIPLLKI